MRVRIQQLDDDGAGNGDIIVFNAASGSWEVGASGSTSGITAEQHKAIRQLIHFIDGGPAEGFASGAEEEIHDSFFPTASIWWTDSSRTDKIVEKTINRDPPSGSNVTPNPITWKMYDTDGSTVLVTVTDEITYNGVKPIKRVRTIAL